MTLGALNFIEEKLGRDAVVRLLKQRAQRSSTRTATGFRFGPERSSWELVKIRDEGGYMAEMGNARKKSSRCSSTTARSWRLPKCFRRHAASSEMFQNLIHADVETSHRVVAGDPVCRFLIRRRGSRRLAATHSIDGSGSNLPKI